MVLPLVGVGIIALAWEAVTRMGPASTTVLPTLSDTLSGLASVLSSAAFCPTCSPRCGLGLSAS